MTKKKTTKKKTGRPTAYQPSYARIAKFMCERGATDKDIAECLGHSESTINKWKHDYPEFSESLKKNKAYFDNKVEMALAERATGYSHKDTKFFMHDGQVITEEYEKHYPPDVTACIYWLNNRKPKEWASRKAIETTVRPDSTVGGVLLTAPVLSNEEWTKLSKQANAQLTKKEREFMSENG
tara:strand:- start:27040 stop:27585 length:546 start_codon:yes stop_codon:yes gene_type:complete